MPSLLVDMGNTSLKFAQEGAPPLLDVRTCPATLAGVETLAGHARDRGVDRLRVASVVPALSVHLEGILSESGIALDWITHTATGLLPHVLDAPANTGIDRLLASRAAWAYHGSGGVGVIVVQAGSAVTVDRVSGEGVYQGGCILPGPRLWLQGLQHAACLGTLGTLPSPPPTPIAITPCAPSTDTPRAASPADREETDAHADRLLSEARETILADAFPECRHHCASSCRSMDECISLSRRQAVTDTSAVICPPHTRAAIATGLRIGWRGAVMAVVEAERGQEALPVVLTGGWAAALDDVVGGSLYHCPHLVLEGIRLVGSNRTVR